MDKNNLRSWSSKYWKHNNALDVIKEAIDSDEIDISSIQIHDTLNPLIWDENDQMKPDIRKTLLKNAKEFINFSDVENLKFNDIILTGSLANYNYNENSDLDVHIIMNFEQISSNIDFVGDFLKMKKELWSDLPIQVKGYDVELYFQNSSEPHQSTGIYSLIKNEWITKPTKKIINIDTANVQLKTAALMNAIDSLENNKNKTNFLEKYTKLKDKIKKYRQTGLDREGEYSIENLVFKVLRNTGYLKKLFDLKDKFLINDLSLDEIIDSEIKREDNN